MTLRLKLKLMPATVERMLVKQPLLFYFPISDHTTNTVVRARVRGWKLRLHIFTCTPLSHKINDGGYFSSVQVIFVCSFGISIRPDTHNNYDTGVVSVASMEECWYLLAILEVETLNSV